MKKSLIFIYGVVAYLCFLGVFLYLLAFLANILVPITVDAAVRGELWPSLTIDVLLVALFGLQHSVMARPTFKAWWTKFVPKEAERSTYVMASNVVLVLMYWQWRPVAVTLWDFQNPITRGLMYALFAAGWVIVLVTTFLINHFDLFGLRQVWLYLRDKTYQSVGFVSPGPYKYVRHPLYVGWITAFWATPTMSLSHLVFAAGMTTYMLVAIVFEERNLAEHHGSSYTEYRQRVGMLVPKLRRGSVRATIETT